jgi:protein-disulfide isomerase
MNKLTVIIIVVALALGGGLMFWGAETSSKPKETINKTEWAKGKLDSKVTVTIFGDFQCPACKSMETLTVKPYLEKYLDKVKFVYKQFPLTSIHAKAQKAAEASEAAGNQGKFWEYHDKLYEVSVADGSTLTTDLLKQYAKDLGLNTEKFNSELDSSKYSGDVKEDVTEGNKLEVSSTPSFFVNGKRVGGPNDTLDVVSQQLILDTEAALNAN